MNILHDYDELLRKLLHTDDEMETYGRPNRTNTRTVSLFAEQIRIPLSTGAFPWPTRKHIPFNSMAGELLTFLQGGRTLTDFHRNGCNFWNPWGTREHLDKAGLEAYDEGELGPIYGCQWRDFNGVDQIERLVEGMIKDPYGRRHIVTAWNPTDNHKMALPPCHLMFQCWFSDDKDELSLHMHMRSADVFVGVPFNIGSYALLVYLLCEEIYKRTGGSWRPSPGELAVTMVDCHLYVNHLEAVQTYLDRSVKSFPSLAGVPALSDWKNTGEVELYYYDPHPAIKVKIAV